MRRFHLVRVRDVHGVSGRGVVAEGVQFGDGRCEVRWLAPCAHGRGSHDSAADVLLVYGHDGATVIEWLDESEPARFGPIGEELIRRLGRRADVLNRLQAPS